MPSRKVQSAKLLGCYDNIIVFFLGEGRTNLSLLPMSSRVLPKMGRTVSQWTAVLVLSLVVININMIPWITLELNHRTLKRHFEQRILNELDPSVVIRYRFTPDEAHALIRPDRHEFKYFGETYDIISEIKEGENVVIRCIPDTEEIQIEKRAADMANATKRAGQNDFQGAKILLCHPELPMNFLPNFERNIDREVYYFLPPFQFTISTDPHPPDFYT